MTKYLPNNLMQLFEARPPLDFMEPPPRKQMAPYTGLSSFLKHFEQPNNNNNKNNNNNNTNNHEPGEVEDSNSNNDKMHVDDNNNKNDESSIIESVTTETGLIPTKEEVRNRKRKRKTDEESLRISKLIKTWKPNENTKATEDAYKTLFVGRLSYETTESKLKREFQEYGPIKNVRLVYDLKGKPRGYAFVEFEKEKDMQVAYKEADAKKIDGKRIVVDVERGRTMTDWKPRRLGGGLGGTRIGADHLNIKISGRHHIRPSNSSSGGGDDRDSGRGSRDSREDDRRRGGGGDDRGGSRDYRRDDRGSERREERRDDRREERRDDRGSDRREDRGSERRDDRRDERRSERRDDRGSDRREDRREDRGSERRDERRSERREDRGSDRRDDRRGGGGGGGGGDDERRRR